jgi:DNA-binding response OmpR family regulator
LDVLRSGAQIDLLITDIGLLDGMNGRELAKAARRARPSLKVLLITGYGEQRIMRDGPLQSGEYALMKPFSMESLVSLVEAIISGEQGASAGGAAGSDFPSSAH